MTETYDSPTRGIVCGDGGSGDDWQTARDYFSPIFAHVTSEKPPPPKPKPDPTRTDGDPTKPRRTDLDIPDPGGRRDW